MLKLALLLVTVPLAITACGTGSPSSGPIPSRLSAIEGSAEDAYDKAIAGDAAAVSGAATTIDDGWTAFRSTAANDGAAPADLSAMDQAVAGLVAAAASPGSGPVAARAANAVSASMDELYVLYDPPTPTELLILDYLGREIVLDGLQTDLTRAGSDLDLVESTWTSLRPRVVSAGGGAEASQYDTSISTLRTDIQAQQASAIVSDANAGLELIDAMEGLF